jgi:hypothetical protein
MIDATSTFAAKINACHTLLLLDDTNDSKAEWLVYEVKKEKSKAS